MSIKTLLTAVGRGAVKHSPTILLVMGIGGMLTSVVWAVKETPKALQAMEEKKNEMCEDSGVELDIRPNLSLKLKDVIQTTWRYYLPSAIIFVASAACLVGGHTVSARRNAALASMYALTETTLRQYKDAITENVEPEIQEKIEDTVSQKQIQRAPDPRDVYVHNINPDGVLFLEPLTGHLFRSDKETIRKAANDIKQDMLNDGFSGSATLEDFLDKLGLNIQSDIKREIGWNIGGNCLDDITFSAQVAANGDPALVLKYNKPPIYNYDTWSDRFAR